MAGLNWSRLDANFATNHKTLTLLDMRGGQHALLVYVFSHGYSVGHGTGGFIPKAALGTFHGSSKDAALLVDVGFWDELPGGWDVHDWADYQPTSEETEQRSARAKHAAEVRWGKEKKH
jgi:hypothetical protein